MQIILNNSCCYQNSNKARHQDAADPNHIVNVHQLNHSQMPCRIPTGNMIAPAIRKPHEPVAKQVNTCVSHANNKPTPIKAHPIIIPLCYLPSGKKLSLLTSRAYSTSIPKSGFSSGSQITYIHKATCKARTPA